MLFQYQGKAESPLPLGSPASVPPLPFVVGLPFLPAVPANPGAFTTTIVPLGSPAAQPIWLPVAPEAVRWPAPLAAQQLGQPVGPIAPIITPDIAAIWLPVYPSQVWRWRLAEAAVPTVVFPVLPQPNSPARVTQWAAELLGTGQASEALVSQVALELVQQQANEARVTHWVAELIIIRTALPPTVSACPTPNPEAEDADDACPTPNTVS